MSLEKLEADAFIRSVILENKKEFNLVDLKNKIDVENAMTIPLIELYTISEDDEEELYTKTATAIENVRYEFQISITFLIIYKIYSLLKCIFEINLKEHIIGDSV